MMNALAELTTESGELSIGRTNAISDLQSIERLQKAVTKKIQTRRLWSKSVLVARDKSGTLLSVGDNVHKVTKGKYTERQAKVKAIKLETVVIQYPISGSITWRKSHNLELVKK